MLFISSLKIFSFSRYLHFCPEFFVYVGKGFDKKAKVNFKTYEVTSLNTSNHYNIHIARYLKKHKQSGNEIWSVDRI